MQLELPLLAVHGGANMDLLPDDLVALSFAARIEINARRGSPHPRKYSSCGCEIWKRLTTASAYELPITLSDCQSLIITFFFRTESSRTH